MLRDYIVMGLGIIKKMWNGAGRQVQRITQADPSTTDGSGAETGLLEAVAKQGKCL